MVRLAVLTAITMVAFAANSLLNRYALAEEAIGPSAFAAIRVGSGAAMLGLLVALRGRNGRSRLRPSLLAVAGLAAYMVGFSFAYVSIDAGLGALILFGLVQATMFVGAVAEGERPSPQRWVGVVLAMSGVALLSLPNGPVEVGGRAVALMVLAGIGWGVYSLIGRGVVDPILATTWNFVLCVPVVAIALLIWPDSTPTTGRGVVLAVLSGAVTSALGYSLWYSLLPALGATRAALSQLSAPAIALSLGALLLGETVTASAVIASVLILGGIAVGLTGRSTVA